MTERPLSGAFDARLFEQVFNKFAGLTPSRVAVAVSGGGDSMALLHMARSAAIGWQVTAISVDHGLRPESADEIAKVAAFCRTVGIDHHSLRWQGPTAQGNLMDQARQARLSLIAAAAREHGIGHVLLGHTADDNAESFLMNLARQSGLDGLCGMRPSWSEQGVTWHRPLMSVTRADLRAYLLHHGVPWIDDPSNDNPHFARVRARRALRALAPVGVTVAGMTATIAHLSDAAQALGQTCAEAATRLAIEDNGALRLARPEFSLAPDLARRLLSATVRWMGGAGYSPRGSQLARLQANLEQAVSGQLGGVRFAVKADHILATREVRAVMGPVPFGQTWDHRWRVAGPTSQDAGRDGLKIRALGAKGLNLCPDWRRFGPRAALLVSPAVWSGDQLIAAPKARADGPYQAYVSQSLPEFILSH